MGYNGIFNAFPRGKSEYLKIEEMQYGKILMESEVVYTISKSNHPEIPNKEHSHSIPIC
jgi:hypothetical protein